MAPTEEAADSTGSFQSRSDGSFTVKLIGGSLPEGPLKIAVKDHCEISDFSVTYEPRDRKLTYLALPTAFSTFWTFEERDRHLEDAIRHVQKFIDVLRQEKECADKSLPKASQSSTQVPAPSSALIENKVADMTLADKKSS